jgi:hypothetical protein
VANPGQVRLLAAVARRDTRLVADGANRLLSSMDDELHAAVAVTLCDLVPECPQIGLEVLDGLLAALRQGHEDNGSIDADLCEALAEIYAFYPRECQAWLALVLIPADIETQTALFQTYERLWRTAERGSKAAPRTARARAVLPDVVAALLPAVTQAALGLDARGKAAEILADIADDFPGLLKPKLESLIGSLALVAQEHFAFTKANPGGDPQIPGYPRAEAGKYDHIVGQVVKALKKMAAFSPAETFTGAVQVFNGLDSKVEAHAATKCYLLKVATALTDDDATALALIHWIYKAMMDSESTLVRIEAINVIGELLQRSNDLVPENMREMLLIYVGDRLVYVAYAAIKAARSLQPDDLTEAKRILSGMLSLRTHFVSQGNHQYERTEVCEAIIRLCRKYPALFDFGLRVLIAEVRNADQDGAAKALREWEWVLDIFPQSRGMYVRELLAYLARHPLEPEDVHQSSNEYRCMLALYEATKAEITSNLTLFPPAIAAAAKVHPFVPLQLLAILLHHEHYSAAATAAASLIESVPEGRHQLFHRDQLLLMEAAALAEAQVAAGNPTEALRILSTEQPRLERYEKKEEPNQPDAFVQAFSLASRIAERIN